MIRLTLILTLTLIINRTEFRYVDFVSVFCLFEEADVLKLAFLMFDPTKSGFVDKDELRFFIYSMHNDDQGSNIERGLK